MNNEIGQKVLAYRQAHGLTQQDVADLVGCSAPSVSCWERGGGMLGITAFALECMMNLNDPVLALQEIRATGVTLLRIRIRELEEENQKLTKQLEENVQDFIRRCLDK